MVRAGVSYTLGRRFESYTTHQTIMADEESILEWVCENPGSDSIDVAYHFNIPIVEAHLVLSDLLARGELDFCSRGHYGKSR